VDYFNPFRNVQIDPGIDIEDLAKVAHAFGEIVGLGLRNVAQCPVELNLVPKSILKRQQFDQKKPYFIAAIFSLVLVVFAYGWFFDRMSQVKASSLDEIKHQLEPLQAKEKDLQKYEGQIKTEKDQTDAFMAWVKWRLFWPDLLGEMRKILLATEDSIEQGRPGTKVGVWIENFGTAQAPVIMQSSDSSEESTSTIDRYRMDPRLAARYGLIKKPVAEGEEGGAATAKATNELENIKVKFRAVNLNRTGDSSANSQLAFTVANAIQSDPFFDKDGTNLSGELEQVTDKDDTFTFGMVLKLRYPGSQPTPAAKKK